MKIILFGVPGSGKGTVAERLSQEYNIPQISTGEIFRENIENGTPLGNKIYKFIERGHLVPDEIVLEVVKQRIAEPDCKNGFILDGFPRTLNQAIKMDKMINADYFFNIEVSPDESIDRLRLRNRQDDTLEIIKERLKIYEELSKPLMDYYGDRMIKINGNLNRMAVYAQIDDFIRKGSVKD